MTNISSKAIIRGPSHTISSLNYTDSELSMTAENLYFSDIPQFLISISYPVVFYCDKGTKENH